MAWFARARWIATAVLFLATLTLAGEAAAREALRFDTGRQPVMLHDAGDAWVDDSGKVGVKDVARDAAVRWHPTSDNNIYKLDRGQALWIRFTAPPAPTAERWYLEVPYPGERERRQEQHRGRDPARPCEPSHLAYSLPADPVAHSYGFGPARQ